MHFIGIDIGTSAVKSVLVDADQRITAESHAPLTVQNPRPNWSEQDPDAWWRAVLSTLGALRKGAGTAWSDVRGIGLSGQMHGAVLLDGQARVLRPAILWNDGRSSAECAELERLVTNLGRIAGAPAMPGFTAPKLLWLARHEPEVFAAIAHVLLPKDFIRHRLTGIVATDLSDAAGTLWLDQAERRWSPVVIAASGLDPARLPPLLEGTALSGGLSARVAADLGLPAGLPVAAGAGDAAAGAIGVGAVEEGDAFLSLGTSAQLFMTTAAYRPKPDQLVHAYCHAVQGRWFQMAAMLNGAGCLAWLGRLLGEPDIGALLALAEREAAAPSGLTFLPYLTGERTPHNDPDARGAFIGLGPETSRAAMARAVLEGVAFSCVDARDCLAVAGSELAALDVIGGGARSGFWLSIIASALDRPLRRLRGGEKGPAFGAARLARIAVTGEPVAEVCTKPEVLEVVAPDPALAAAYAARQAHFRGLYGRLKGAFLPPS